MLRGWEFLFFWTECGIQKNRFLRCLMLFFWLCLAIVVQPMAGQFFKDVAFGSRDHHWTTNSWCFCCASCLSSNICWLSTIIKAKFESYVGKSMLQWWMNIDWMLNALSLGTETFYPPQQNVLEMTGISSSSICCINIGVPLECFVFLVILINLSFKKRL